jgi:dipeptidyl aminopeptidase/acylaminoacyl peptidase
LGPHHNRKNLFIQTIGQGLSVGEPVLLTDERERDINSFFWKGDSFLVYARDTAGDENFGLWAMPRTGGEPRPLTAIAGVKTLVVDPLRYHPTQLLVALNKRQREIFDAYRLDVATGELQLELENPGNHSGWLTDHTGCIRIAHVTDGVETRILHRPDAHTPFAQIVHTTFRDSVSPQFFTADNRYLYALSDIGRNTQAAVLLNPSEGSEIAELLDDPDYDIQALHFSHHRGVLVGASIVRDKREYHFFDPEAEGFFAGLEERFPGWEISLASQDLEENRAIIRLFSDRSLGEYHLADRDTGKVVKLCDLSPWLPPAHLMAPMEPICFATPDGFRLHGYLTLPVGHTIPQNGQPPLNVPVVVNPHGGPWHRDTWGFVPEVQFLANRGYAVLQVNFRGSTGYGKAFWQAGFKQWGLKMQDDVTLATRWLIEQGIAHPHRIAIYGGSYGGYCALAGLAFTEGLYACGIDFVGVSNLFTFLQTIPPYWKPYLEMMYEMVGHPERDADQLKSTSPVFHPHKITAPLFIAQGANDPRVVKAESDQMVEALRSQGVEVQYLVKEDEGHGFVKQENRFDFYRALEAFLARHIGAH